MPRRKAITQSAHYGATVQTYKEDARSLVWRMAGGHVAKRFVHSPVRQRATLLVGRHPAQLEWRANRTLRAAGVAVVPIVDGGIERVGVGSHVWLVTPWMGESLQHVIRDRAEGLRADAVLAAAALTRRLLEAGLVFRDLKPSNIVLDAEGRAHLLDVGSVRATRSPKRIAAMLAVMDRVLARDGADEALRRRYAEAVGDVETLSSRERVPSR